MRAVFDAVDGPAVTTSDVAQRLDVTTQSARSKLDALVDRGDCECRKTGRTIVYWRTDE
ncbi:response regulator of citrate/malate metabolism [Halococcoides cellulosivorans]|uniref:Response regulator of citrate/malate metabolism n=1 Tax=Halococcoides cellulosivorans TaxID=1679096 RepID=A0A2R4X445_9EURY|nr:response regulator of citrate/malate metabolism [Halococcoides cellulosivorans]